VPLDDTHMTLIMILAVYGLSYMLRNLNGPFNLIGIVRNKLISLHVFFYELLMCPWCFGTYMGIAVYLIATQLGTELFTTGGLMLWALAGSVIVPLMDELFTLVSDLNGEQ
jgi:hypothetical protein